MEDKYGCRAITELIKKLKENQVIEKRSNWIAIQQVEKVI